MVASPATWSTRRRQNAMAKAAVQPGAGRVVPKWREITAEERQAIEALLCLRYPENSLDKRFVIFCERSTRITERGGAYLGYLRHRYRKQIPDSVPLLAEGRDAIMQVPIVNPSPDAEAT